MNGQGKITRSHRERTALIYVRQSTVAQVRDHGESTARQYDLAQAAVDLGWPPQRVVVIDADLGLSGRTAGHRRGFQDVVTQVCLGEVGAITGLEASRLARSSADFARLLEIARLSGTLLIDADGVYDLADINDRLVLGLKGQMSEAELHLLKARLDGAKRAAAARGDLRLRLPIGYFYDPDAEVVIDPDTEVAAAVADVFACFAATGSAYAVVSAFTGRRFPYRVHGGPFDGDLRWGRLTHDRVLSILANPAYAGAYAYGRRPSAQRLAPDGSVHTVTATRPRDQWPVLIPGHHPSYITWEQYEANEAKRAANHTRRGARPPREGTALCQGIITCGSCGSPMRTRYPRARHHRVQYFCGASHEAHRPQTSTCRTLPTAPVDHAVADLLLAALTPSEVDRTLAAADEVVHRTRRSLRAAEVAVERARYQAERAERAFSQVEPENRLVARTLESRWEARLAEIAEAEQALTELRATQPELPERVVLEQLVGDVEALWHAPTTTDRDRKRLMRTLIADVTVLPEPDTQQIRIGVRWHTGATDTLTFPTREPRSEPTAVQLIREYGITLPDTELVGLLNSQGLTTARGKPFTIASMRWTRQNHHLPSPSTPRIGEITVTAAARILGINPSAVYRWIARGRLTARRTTVGRLCVPWDPSTEAACQSLIAASPQIKPRPSLITSGGAV
ncbi:recombinase family protein [Streptomyces sp. NPDC057909]|uniref:recombinase family protein n=1 Tax=Streptomyces sp. NPDC057909 TaxID=3346277 RepID=UPI0036EE0094